MRNDNKGLYRSADLSGATSATLTLDYRKRSLHESSQYATLEVSSDGGSQWTTLDTFAGPANETVYTTISYNIDSFISSQTTIRFTSHGMSDGNRVIFDNIEIAFDTGRGGNNVAAWQGPIQQKQQPAASSTVTIQRLTYMLGGQPIAIHV